MKLMYQKILSGRAILLFIAGILLFSCKSQFATLTIENARPAKEELSSEIQSITLMNRSMNSQFMNHVEDSLQLYFYRNGYQLSTIVLDSTAADTTIFSLASLLYESGRYDVVVPIERNIARILPYDILPDALNPDQVKQICTDYNTDALLVLERLSMKTMADYTSEKYQDAATGANYSYYATLDLKYNAFFRLYMPGNNSLIKEFVLIDTIYWESADFMQEDLFRKLPTVKKALINAGIKVALDLDSKLSPTWVSEKRGYFLFHKKNDPGQQFMTENNFEAAANYWNELARSENKKIRSKAEYNLALVSELNGNIDGAIEWGLKSFHSNYRHQTDTYLRKLKDRKETLKKTE